MKNLLIAFLFTLFSTIVYADCTGCGDDGHQVCPIEKKHKHVTVMKEEHKESSSDPMSGVVFADHSRLLQKAAVWLRLNGLRHGVNRFPIVYCLGSPHVYGGHADRG